MAAVLTSMANQVSGRDVLGRAGDLAGDELEVVARRDVDHAGADALDAAVALVGTVSCVGLPASRNPSVS